VPTSVAPGGRTIITILYMLLASWERTLYARGGCYSGTLASFVASRYMRGASPPERLESKRIICKNIDTKSERTLGIKHNNSEASERMVNSY